MWWIVGLLLASLAAPLSAGVVGPAVTNQANYRWFSIPLEVRNLPARSEHVAVSAEIDCAALLQKANVTGTVDTHGLRLFRAAPTGEVEQIYQFTPRPQARRQARMLLPGTPKSVSYVAEFGAGEKMPVTADGTLTWIASGMLGATQKYRLQFGVPRDGRAIQVPYAPHDLHAFDAAGRATARHWFSTMQIRPQYPFEGGVKIFCGEQLVTKYYTGPTAGKLDASTLRRPFLYPVNGPDGIALTEFGKSHDPTGSHAHHYSLWIAHANVDGHDFWSERGGVIVHEQFADLEDGPLFARVRQKTRWALGETNLLREQRTVTFQATPEDFRLIDFELEFTSAGAKPVRFGDTSFGFLAARVAQSLSPFDGGGEIVNANGARNEQAAHLQRAGWIDQSGPIGQDKWGGIAMFDHPDNANYPTAWHCRNDGWACASFNFQNPFTLAPGKTLRLRYRVCLHRGDARRGDVARRFEEWAAKPLVELGPVRALD